LFPIAAVKKKKVTKLGTYSDTDLLFYNSSGGTKYKTDLTGLKLK
jgi:hypothetical protein